MTKTQLKTSLTFTMSSQSSIYMRKSFYELQKLSFILISVFFLSCEDPTSIALKLEGDLPPNSIFTDTLNLSLSTVLSDSSVNNNANYIIAGNTIDPIFGKISTISYFQPSLPTDGSGLVYGLNAKSTAIADSIQLRLVNSGFIYGDTLPKGSYKIYRLKKSMDLDKNLNGDQGLEYESTVLSSFSINSRSFRNDSLSIAFYVKLPVSLVDEIIKLDSATGTNKKSFNTAFRGFAIVPDNNTMAAYSFSTGPLNSATSTLIAYWHDINTTAVQSYQFDLNGPRHTQFMFDRKSTNLSELTKTTNEISNSKTGNKTYIQSGAGISTKIGFENLSKLGTNIKVSKAYLEFSIDQSTTSTRFRKVFNYVLAEADSRNQQIRNASKQKLYLTPVSSLSTAGVVSGLVDSTNLLTIDVTDYVQKLALNKTANKSLLLLPSALTSTGFGILSNDQLSRSVFLKPKFYIYYTK